LTFSNAEKKYLCLRPTFFQVKRESFILCECWLKSIITQLIFLGIKKQQNQCKLQSHHQFASNSLLFLDGVLADNGHAHV